MSVGPDKLCFFHLLFYYSHKKSDYSLIIIIYSLSIALYVLHSETTIIIMQNCMDTAHNCDNIPMQVFMKLPST